MAEENDRPTAPGADPAQEHAAGRREPTVSADPPAPGAPVDSAAAGEASGPDQSAEGLATRLAEAQQQLEQHRDQALRAQAEAENIRRRASRDVENAHKFALEKFTADLLPVLDSLEKAVEVASGVDGAKSIAEGVELSLKLFLNVLEKYGIQRIYPIGEPFDPQHHEALTMVPSPHAEPNSVVDVMQAGYVLNGRLVRAAKVVVAKAPDPAPTRNGQ